NSIHSPANVGQTPHPHKGVFMILQRHPPATAIRFAVTSALILIVAARAGATIDVTLQMQLGNATNATSDPNNHSHYLIQRAQYALDYDDTLGGPNWVSWDLTSGDIGSTPR